MDTEDVVHVHNEILLSRNKNEILPFATTCMDLEGIMLSTWTVNFQMFKLNLEKAEEPEIKLLTSAGS